MRTVNFHLVKTVDGIKIYAPYCNYENEYMLEIIENERPVCILVKDKKAHLVYKNFRNYRANNVISKYDSVVESVVDYL